MITSLEQTYKTHEEQLEEEEKQEQGEEHQRWHNDNVATTTTPHQLTSASTHELLLAAADFLLGRSNSDSEAARPLLSFLSSSTSPDGDAADRLSYHFAGALSVRLLSRSSPSTSEALQSSYLCLNKVTPFLRFCHLTANQAILEAVGSSRAVHILDLDVMHGVQWPPLMQAIADHHHQYPTLTSLRITGCGGDIEVLRRTGARLRTFAGTLGLRFQFQPLHLPARDDAALLKAVLELRGGEENGVTLAVNCMSSTIKGGGGGEDVGAFLRAVKAMGPAAVTIAEREVMMEAKSSFRQRVEAALEHYGAVFESLEATLPPTSRERLEVEEVWFGREIADAVLSAAEDNPRGRWEEEMRAAGFCGVEVSPFAAAQARMLLRLHYPSEGYRLLQARSDSQSLVLGWRQTPLYSVSAWH